jgi:hypothetical protein
MIVFEKYFEKLIASLNFQNIFFKSHILDKKKLQVRAMPYIFVLPGP